MHPSKHTHPIQPEIAGHVSPVESADLGAFEAPESRDARVAYGELLSKNKGAIDTFDPSGDVAEITLDLNVTDAYQGDVSASRRREILLAELGLPLRFGPEEQKRATASFVHMAGDLEVVTTISRDDDQLPVDLFFGQEDDKGTRELLSATLMNTKTADERRQDLKNIVEKRQMIDELVESFGYDRGMLLAKGVSLHELRVTLDLNRMTNTIPAVKVQNRIVEKARRELVRAMSPLRGRGSRAANERYAMAGAVYEKEINNLWAISVKESGADPADLNNAEKLRRRSEIERRFRTSRRVHMLGRTGLVTVFGSAAAVAGFATTQIPDSPYFDTVSDEVHGAGYLLLAGGGAVASVALNSMRQRVKVSNQALDDELSDNPGADVLSQIRLEHAAVYRATLAFKLGRVNNRKFP